MIDESLKDDLPEPVLVKSEQIEFNRLRCEACNKRLVHLIVTAPQDPVSSRNAVGRIQTRDHKSASAISYQAECPFCGDKSKPKVVQGSVCPVPEPDLMIVDVELNGNKSFIRTMKRA